MAWVLLFGDGGGLRKDHPTHSGCTNSNNLMYLIRVNFVAQFKCLGHGWGYVKIHDGTGHDPHDSKEDEYTC